MIGCTDISDSTPVNEWTRDLQRGAGNDNDEIAVSPPFWLDIDGEGTPEILVGFGRRFWAFDGDTGASADINSAWSSPLSMPHRVWTAPAVADVDGDGHAEELVATQKNLVKINFAVNLLGNVGLDKGFHRDLFLVVLGGKIFVLDDKVLLPIGGATVRLEVR